MAKTATKMKSSSNGKAGASAQASQSRPRGRSWRDSDLNRLRAMVGKKPVSQIASKLNRTPGAIQQKMFQLGLRARG